MKADIDAASRARAQRRRTVVGLGVVSTGRYGRNLQSRGLIVLQSDRLARAGSANRHTAEIYTARGEGNRWNRGAGNWERSPAARGDSNRDGAVDGADFARLERNLHRADRVRSQSAGRQRAIVGLRVIAAGHETCYRRRSVSGVLYGNRLGCAGFARLTDHLRWESQRAGRHCDPDDVAAIRNR